MTTQLEIKDQGKCHTIPLGALRTARDKCGAKLQAAIKNQIGTSLLEELQVPSVIDELASYPSEDLPADLWMEIKYSSEVREIYKDYKSYCHRVKSAERRELARLVGDPDKVKRDVEKDRLLQPEREAQDLYLRHLSAVRDWPTIQHQPPSVLPADPFLWKREFERGMA